MLLVWAVARTWWLLKFSRWILCEPRLRALSLVASKSSFLMIYFEQGTNIWAGKIFYLHFICHSVVPSVINTEYNFQGKEKVGTWVFFEPTKCQALYPPYLLVLLITILRIQCSDSRLTRAQRGFGTQRLTVNGLQSLHSNLTLSQSSQITHVLP